MAVKIRLQRHGKKDAAFFHVVAADGRAPRDGAKGTGRESFLKEGTLAQPVKREKKRKPRK